MPVVDQVTSQLGSAIDELIDTDPTRLADGETIQVLHRELERFHAAVTRATAAFDASGTWKHDGARSAAAWLAASTKLPIGTARRRVRLGRELRHLEVLEEAWLGGEVGEAQVGLVVRARTPATEESLARDQDMLVDHARRLRFASFARVMAYWVQWADPDGAEDEAAAAHASRRLHLSQGFGGRWVLDGILDPIGGSILDAAPADGRRPEPLFIVLVGYEASLRVCELANRTVVSPGSLVPYLDEAWMELTPASLAGWGCSRPSSGAGAGQAGRAGLCRSSRHVARRRGPIRPESHP